MLEDLLAGKERYFETGVHTELRAQENRYRNVWLVQGNMTGNSRSEVSGVPFPPTDHVSQMSLCGCCPSHS